MPVPILSVPISSAPGQRLQGRALPKHPDPPHPPRPHLTRLHLTRPCLLRPCLSCLFAALVLAALVLATLASVGTPASAQSPSHRENLVGVPPSTLNQGLVHCWFFTAKTPPADPCGTPASPLQLQATSGSGPVAPILTAPGVAGANAQRLVPRGYIAQPGKQYIATPGYTYQAAGARVGTWGDGKPHTYVLLTQFDQFAYTSSGNSITASTPLQKAGEFLLAIKAAQGGSITLNLGGDSSRQVTALPYPAEPMNLAVRPTNPQGLWYQIAFWYDGKSQACIALNDSPAASCVSGVHIDPSANPLRFGTSNYVEYLLEYSRVLNATERQALYSSTISPVAPYFAPASTANTYSVPGSPCIRGNAWGNSFGSNGFTIPNPYSTCTIQTDAPYLTLEEVVLQDQSQDQNPNTAQIQVSLDDPAHGRRPYATLIPGSLGPNSLTVALPNDGKTHAVTFDVSSYVGYSGSDATPTARMRAAVVESVSVPAGYILQPVPALTPAQSSSTSWLFYTDSIGIGAETNLTSSDGYIGQLRESGAYPGEIEFESFGGRALLHDMPTPAAAATFADTLKARYGCPAHFTAEVMTNDYGRALQTAATGSANMAAFWLQWNKDCPYTKNVQQSAFRRAIESPNRLGDTLTSWRVAMANACSAARHCTNQDLTAPAFPGPGIDCPVNGTTPTTAGGFASLSPDGIHLTTCGATMARTKAFP